jgi:hypothetical protein
MSAAEALKAARAAGIQLAIKGEDLVLEAPAPPSPVVIDLLRRHKTELVALLRPTTIGCTPKSPMVAPVTPVTVQKQHFQLEGETAAPWGEEEEERAAIAEYDGGAPRVWAEALARLDPARPPCDIPPIRWLRFIDDCGRFLDDGWAARAEALGWGPLDLFGCNRDKPFARISQAGLLWLLEGRKLLALTADTAAIATHSGGKLTFYRRQIEAGGVLAWELGAAQ